MEKIEWLLARAAAGAMQELYQTELKEDQFTFNETPKNFTGDLTLVVFPLTKYSRQSPEATAQALGNYFKEKTWFTGDFNVVKGFLNIIISDAYLMDFLQSAYLQPDFGKSQPKGVKVLVEYSSPNTNKPLHLGHVRNNVLGLAISGLLRAAGYDVSTCNLVNDRGIHICKSMLAWQLSGAKDTPESTGMKGDKLVGHYYVAFEKQLQEEAAPLLDAALRGHFEALPEKDKPVAERLAERIRQTDDADKKEELKDQLKTLVRNATPIMQQAREMLQQWEAGDPEIVELWKKMNAWVYAGFEETYRWLGVTFDKIYYESDSYLLGKDIVQEGLEKGIFYRKEDGSIWVDLTAEGLDHKLLLRSDGTSVYITQDLGTADLRYKDFAMDRCIYVVGNEQEYHFKVLRLIMKKLGRPYADGLYHFSYGMVDLPSGKMKSREGTVVDADDLIAEMIENARQQTEELGKIDGFSEAEARQLYATIGIGALKFFLLRVDPKKRILFNPQESIDLHGYTGPFVQYTYARIRSLMRRFETEYGELTLPAGHPLENAERELLVKLNKYPSIVAEAAEQLNPARLVDYIYELARLYNKFYAELTIFNAGEATARHRTVISALTAKVIADGFKMVGIDVPERM